MNAYDENGSINCDLMEFGVPPLFPYADGSMPEQKDAEARHVRWQIDLNKGKIEKTVMDDLTGEFPRIDDRFALQKHSHGYYAGNIGKHPKGMSLNTIVHYNFLTEEREHFTTKDGGAVGEPVFIPKSFFHSFLVY